MAPVLIIRHRRENPAKCTVEPLAGRSGFCFFRYPDGPLPDKTMLRSAVVLSMVGPVISSSDADRPLLLIDATWRLAGRIHRWLDDQLVDLSARSLPSSLVTAYPRRQPDCPQPERGLATVEALYAACLLSRRPTAGLLDAYRWSGVFLDRNAAALQVPNDTAL